MSVAEYIEKLSTFPPNAEVLLCSGNNDDIDEAPSPWAYIGKDGEPSGVRVG